MTEDEKDDGEECEVGSESGDSEAGGKRKKRDQEKDVRTKKKKMKKDQMAGKCLFVDPEQIRNKHAM